MTSTIALCLLYVSAVFALPAWATPTNTTAPIGSDHGDVAMVAPGIASKAPGDLAAAEDARNSRDCSARCDQQFKFCSTFGNFFQCWLNWSRCMDRCDSVGSLTPQASSARTCVAKSGPGAMRSLVSRAHERASYLTSPYLLTIDTSVNGASPQDLPASTHCRPGILDDDGPLGRCFRACRTCQETRNATACAYCVRCSDQA